MNPRPPCPPPPRRRPPEGGSLLPPPGNGPLWGLVRAAAARRELGDHAEAARICDVGVGLAEPAGERPSALALRFLACLVAEEAGDWPALQARTAELLAVLGPDAGPYWRARVLAVRSHALMQRGDWGEAFDCLATGYGLVCGDGRSAEQGEACRALSEPLASALLFDPALELLGRAETLLGATARAGVAARDAAAVELTRGLFVELLGQRGAAGRAYACAGTHALRAQALADGGGEPGLSRQAQALVAVALQRLRAEPGAMGALTEVASLPRAGQVGLLARLALASAWARAGRLEDAWVGTEAVRRDAVRLGEAVVGWVAMAWLAELAEARRPGGEASRRWRAVAVTQLRRLEEDRVGRFEALVARHRVSELTVRVAREGRRLREDPLTGIGNRLVLDRLLATADAGSRPVAFLDVDWFKRVNDEHGHAVGDEVLRRVARIVRDACGRADVPLRYGGDEFVVLVSPTGDPVSLARRIGTAVADAPWEDLSDGLRVSVTIGTAAAGPAALQRADTALRRAKAARQRPREGSVVALDVTSASPSAGSPGRR